MFFFKKAENKQKRAMNSTIFSQTIVFFRIFPPSSLHVQVPGGYTCRLEESTNAGSCLASFHAMRDGVSL